MAVAATAQVTLVVEVWAAAVRVVEAMVEAATAQVAAARAAEATVVVAMVLLLELSTALWSGVTKAQRMAGAMVLLLASWSGLVSDDQRVRWTAWL